MNIQTVYGPILRHFRRSRLPKFYATHKITKDSRVLDIGGTPSIWELAGSMGYPVPRVTLLNPDKPSTLPAWATWIDADARAIPFAAGSFDLAFSNSVIEHLGTLENQAAMAREVSRVARAYWVQTPDIRFPFEPHYLAPFVHWVPRRYRHFASRLTPWAMIVRPTSAEIRDRVKEIRLLSVMEMRALFPDASLITERFLGWPKSLVVSRGDDGRHGDT
jgi:hypothetical protein